MPKPLSAPSILREAIKAGALPAGLEVSRHGEARWTRDGLELTARAAKNHEGELDWGIQFADAKFADTMDKYGRWSVLVFGTENDPTAWPSTGDADAITALNEGFREAAAFFTGRSDFARTTAETGDVTRGRVHVSLPAANYPARLVTSLILARDLDDAELADAVLKALSEDKDVKKSAQSWAKRYSKELGFAVSLTALGWRP